MKLITFHSLRGGVGRSRYALDAALDAARNAANFGEPELTTDQGPVPMGAKLPTLP
jgi:hypothetical protein